MEKVEFVLAISREEYLRHYQSQGRLEVRVTALDGRRVRFVAGILQPFVLHDGVHGHFVIEFDTQGRLSSIYRVR